MKKLSNPIFITCGSAVLGLLCMLARLWLMTNGVDRKELLLPSHPGNILSWVLTFLMAVFLAAGLLSKPARLSFRSNRLSGIGSAVCAVSMARIAWMLFSATTSMLSLAAGIFAVLGVLCCSLLVIYRFGGKRPRLLLQLPTLLTLMLLFLHNFQLWSAEPELQRYFFSMTAHVFLLLTFYYRAAAACKMAKVSAYLLCSCCGIFFGLSAAADSSTGLLYAMLAVTVLLENLSGCLRGSVHHDAA